MAHVNVERAYTNHLPNFYYPHRNQIFLQYCGRETSGRNLMVIQVTHNRSTIAQGAMQKMYVHRPPLVDFFPVCGKESTKGGRCHDALTFPSMNLQYGHPSESMSQGGQEITIGKRWSVTKRLNRVQASVKGYLKSSVPLSFVHTTSVFLKISSSRPDRPAGIRLLLQ